VTLIRFGWSISQHGMTQALVGPGLQSEYQKDILLLFQIFIAFVTLILTTLTTKCSLIISKKLQFKTGGMNTLRLIFLEYLERSSLVQFRHICQVEGSGHPTRLYVLIWNSPWKWETK